MKKRIMVQCATKINKSAIRRESIGGIEHVIVSSSTLPDDIVMNGGLYPADEIAKSFATLERTLAPVEHPTDSNGNFLSASDPEAIHNFHAGAFNVNVTRENGRVHIEKHINVQEALKTDRGKRLMDRIEEIETNSEPRPVHTSVGLFLLVDELKEPKINAQGDKYTWIAREMVFDHDAILLDSVAAAPPEKGVGMAVNSNGDKIEVNRVLIGNEDGSNDTAPKPRDMRTNAEGQSFAQVTEQLQQEINGIVSADWIWLVDVFDTEAIFETNQGYFSVPYNMREGRANIAGIPIRVDKKVEYQPKINSQQGDDQMKELILNALAEAGIATEGLSDDQLFAEHCKLQAKTNDDDDDGDGGDGAGGDGTNPTGLEAAINKAVGPLVEKIDGLTKQINDSDEKDRAELTKAIVNSDKYPGLTEDDVGAMAIEIVRTMAGNCGTAFGVPLTINQDGGSDLDLSTEMPD